MVRRWTGLAVRLAHQRHGNYVIPDHVLLHRLAVLLALRFKRGASLKHRNQLVGVPLAGVALLDDVPLQRHTVWLLILERAQAFAGGLVELFGLSRGAELDPLYLARL